MPKQPLFWEICFIVIINASLLLFVNKHTQLSTLIWAYVWELIVGGLFAVTFLAFRTIPKQEVSPLQRKVIFQIDLFMWGIFSLVGVTFTYVMLEIITRGPPNTFSPVSIPLVAGFSVLSLIKLLLKKSQWKKEAQRIVRLSVVFLFAEAILTGVLAISQFNLLYVIPAIVLIKTAIEVFVEIWQAKKSSQ